MGAFNQPVKYAGYVLMGVGILLLALNVDGLKVRPGAVALPLVILLLAGASFVLVFVLEEKLGWGPILYIPAALLFAFRVVYLFFVLTEDEKSWIYSWLLMVSGAGAGTVLAYRRMAWPPVVNLAGWATALSSAMLFALLGALVKGPFIQVLAPVLILLVGLALRFLHPERALPISVLQRLHFLPAEPPGPPLPSDGQFRLVEPLSAREIEVLRLVDQGLSNQAIASQLSIAPSTVKTHLNNLYGKLSVETRTQALHRARRLGLLESTPHSTPNPP